MDLDSCGKDDFDDELSSFMPPSDDFNLDDFDEIFRSVDSHLDSSIDLNTFVPHDVHHFDKQMHDISMQDDDQNQQHNFDDFNFEFSAFPSPATSQSAFTPPYESQRTSSTSSMDGEQSNVDEFINLLNDDDIKIEELTRDSSMMDMPRRHTPSPTGSCSSSSGSSTSGIQSDASSVASMTRMFFSDDKAIKMDKQDVERGLLTTPCEDTTFAVPLPPTTSTIPAITVPLLPLQSTTAGAATILQPVNILQGTIMPVKTVPLTTDTQLAHIKVPTAIKADNKLVSKPTQQSPLLRTVTTNATANGGKLTPPPNTKPKTIYLSSNDFKSLMQKMNSNGSKTGHSNGAKITGGIPGQVPKIIMKTANGQVIATNKIVQSISNKVGQSTQAAHNFVPKYVKSTGPLTIKQQPSKVIATNLTNVTAARASLSPSSPELSIYKGTIDEKIMKKQQRMIKNRESASLSRKKKKEYVVSLETRIHNLEKENYTLKGENSSLRSQLLAFAQTCQCKHSNVSEFILNSLNINTKCNGLLEAGTASTGNRGGAGAVGGGGGGGNGVITTAHHHVKIAPKPASGKSIKQRMIPANVKKNVAVLFAMAFMVTLNAGNFKTYFNKNSIENSVDPIAEEPTAAVAATGRRLLWVETESEFNEKLNRTKRIEAELEVPPPPPLHFLRPVNRTAGTNGTVQSGVADELSPPPLLGSQCAVGGSNYTENLRLASNLHKWIDGNDFLNLSIHEKFKGNMQLENPSGFKLTPGYMDLHRYDHLPLQGPIGKRKLVIEPKTQYESKQRKLDNTDPTTDNGNVKNSLDIFKPKISDEYLRLFKGIKRQDDTFYVLSFNMDHILLPASSYNKSSRPKMSLMLPAGDPSLNGDVVLMQIDCEVVNTTELELKSHMIPEKLRPNQKYGNGSNFHPAPQPNDVANNETGSHRKPQMSNKMPLKVEETVRDKPVIRTYFMVGPKTQAAAVAQKKNPTIVKLSAEEVGRIRARPQFTVLGSNGNSDEDANSDGDDVKMKNSTLFAKMRGTVESNIDLMP